jgi:hypothetical protein
MPGATIIIVAGMVNTILYYYTQVFRYEVLQSILYVRRLKDTIIIVRRKAAVQIIKTKST